VTQKKIKKIHLLSDSNTIEVIKLYSVQKQTGSQCSSLGRYDQALLLFGQSILVVVTFIFFIIFNFIF